jgi:hypothetical protein
VSLMSTGAGDPIGQQGVWFGGGKLAPDLSLPQLRARWGQDDATSREQAGGQLAPASRTGGPAHAPVVDLSELERRRLWVGAESAVHRADADIGYASSHPSDTAAQATAQAAAASAAEVFGALSWLVERKRGGPLHKAAEDYSRAARELHRRTVPATEWSRSTRSAAGALLSARLVKRSETRQLLALLDRLTALSESLARLRVTQGRAAQALAARRAAEQLTTEQHRRSHAASAAVSSAVSNAVPSAATSTTKQAQPSVQLPPPYRPTSGPANRGPSATR